MGTLVEYLDAGAHSGLCDDCYSDSIYCCVRGDPDDALDSRHFDVRIAAEVPSYARKKYWNGTDSVRSAVDSAFWRSGVRAIIAGGRGVRGDVPGWQPLAVEGYFVKWPAAP